MKTLPSGKVVRTFTINSASHADGCPTKFSHNGKTGSFTNKTSPARAASKAFTHLCNVKRIHGKCSLYIGIRETTQGSKKKVYTYKANRVKLDKPGPFGNEYTNKITAVDAIPSEKCSKSYKSRGRMSRRSLKISKSKSKRHQ